MVVVSRQDRYQRKENEMHSHVPIVVPLILDEVKIFIDFYTVPSAIQFWVGWGVTWMAFASTLLEQLLLGTELQPQPQEAEFLTVLCRCTYFTYSTCKKCERDNYAHKCEQENICQNAKAAADDTKMHQGMVPSRFSFLKCKVFSFLLLLFL